MLRVIPVTVGPIVNVDSFFVCILKYILIMFVFCLLVFFTAWLFVCAVVEIDQYYESTSPDIAKFRQ